MREEVTKFTCPVVTEVRGELFKTVDMGIELEYYQVDDELFDCEYTASVSMLGKDQGVIFVQLEEESEWESFNTCKVERCEFVKVLKVLPKSCCKLRGGVFDVLVHFAFLQF